MTTIKVEKIAKVPAPALAVGQIWQVGNAHPERFVRIEDAYSNTAPSLGLAKVKPCNRDGTKPDGVVLISYPPRSLFNNQRGGYIFVSDKANS